MTLAQKEQLSTQNNAQETHKNGSLIERTKIEGTPFTLINDGEKEFLAMGDYRLTEDLTNEIEIDAYIEKNKWQLIMRIAGIVTEKTLQELGRMAEQKQQAEEKGPIHGSYPIQTDTFHNKERITNKTN